MFLDVDTSELALTAVVALLVIGPKDLPRVLRTVGHWVGRARGLSRHVRTGFDTMVREAEIDEMNRRWDEQNRAIMAATPSLDPIRDPPLKYRGAGPGTPNVEPPPSPGSAPTQP